MTKGRRIAEGRTAEVFAWGGDQILKIFRPGFKSNRAESEAACVRAVHAAGLPSPAVIDVVEVDGRPGILYERRSGATMLSAMLATSDKLIEYARSLAELHADMHALGGGGRRN
jgi:tRNA A-37 threonylcarbamoyl transferase component Bud32